VGVLSDLVIADRSEATAINEAEGGHLKQWPCLESKGIDNVKLGMLWSILSETEYDSSFMGDDSILDQPSDEGPWVMLVPEEMVSAIANLDDSRVETIGRVWAKIEEFESDGWAEDSVLEYFKEFAQFAKNVQEQKKDLLLWMCL
jgi:hypothetical protein